MDFDFIPSSGDSANSKLEKLKEQIHKHSKHPLPPEIMAKIRTENRRQKLLTYLLLVLLGIALLVIASIIDAQISPEQTEEPVPTEILTLSPEMRLMADLIVAKLWTATAEAPTATPTATATPAPPTAPSELVMRDNPAFHLTLFSGMAPAVATRMLSGWHRLITEQPERVFYPTATPVTPTATSAPARVVTVIPTEPATSKQIDDKFQVPPDWQLYIKEKVKREYVYWPTYRADLRLSCAIWGDTTFNNDPHTYSEWYQEVWTEHCVTRSWRNPINVATATAEHAPTATATNVPAPVPPPTVPPSLRALAFQQCFPGGEAASAQIHNLERQGIKTRTR